MEKKCYHESFCRGRLHLVVVARCCSSQAVVSVFDGVGVVWRIDKPLLTVSKMASKQAIRQSGNQAIKRECNNSLYSCRFPSNKH